MLRLRANLSSYVGRDVVVKKCQAALVLLREAPTIGTKMAIQRALIPVDCSLQGATATGTTVLLSGIALTTEPLGHLSVPSTASNQPSRQILVNHTVP